MILYEGPDNLDKRESQARDIMVDIFNPVLKHMFAEANLKEFTRYGFNSCIQTGVFAGFLLKTLFLPDYEVSTYKGQFVDNMYGQIVEYMHCFNVASKYGRNILIDLSRTEKPLLFHKTGILEYPKTGRYSHMALISKEKIDIKEYVMMKEGEYYTSLQPTDVIAKLTEEMKELSNKPRAEREMFKTDMYRKYTHLFEI